MQQASRNHRKWRSTPWRIVAWSVAAGLMLVPVTVQLVSGNFGWSTGDFIFAAIWLAAAWLFRRASTLVE